MVQDRYLSECDDNKLDKTVSDVVKLLKQRNWKIASAESCTGGFVSQMITSVSGASSVFELGLCTYSDRMKHNLLGVPEEILQKYGAVSPQTAEAMVRGLHKKSGADVCISVTGIAGPDGGTEKTPVGTVLLFRSVVNNKLCSVLLGLYQPSQLLCLSVRHLGVNPV